MEELRKGKTSKNHELLGTVQVKGLSKLKNILKIIKSNQES